MEVALNSSKPSSFEERTIWSSESANLSIFVGFHHKVNQEPLKVLAKNFETRMCTPINKLLNKTHMSSSIFQGNEDF
jgi:hypothetical protein